MTQLDRVRRLCPGWELTLSGDDLTVRFADGDERTVTLVMRPFDRRNDEAFGSVLRRAISDMVRDKIGEPRRKW